MTTRIMLLTFVAVTSFILPGFGKTNYVFTTGGGMICAVGESGSYDENRNTVIIGSEMLGGIHWDNCALYSTTSTIPHDFTNICQVVGVKVHPLTEQEKQSRKSKELKSLENAFILLCEQITGKKEKASMEVLQSTVETLGESDPMLAIRLSLKLLAVDSALKREGGNLWWDTCAFHSEEVIGGE